MVALLILGLTTCGGVGQGAIQSGAVSHGTITNGNVAPQPDGGPVCGNGVIEGSEVCDSGDLNGETCASQGAYTGTLACNETCTGYDTSSCCGEPPQTALSIWLDASDIDGDDTLDEESAGAVATWVSKGSVTDNPTQGTGSAQPTLTESCIATSKRCVRFDGGDVLAAATAANFNFMHNGTGVTAYVALRTTSSNPNALQGILATNPATTARGVFLALDDRASQSRNDTTLMLISNGTAAVINATSGNDTASSAAWHNVMWRSLDDGGAGNDGFQYVDGTLRSSHAGAAAFSASAATAALRVGSASDGTLKFTGDIAQVLIYSADHDDATRALVEDWLGCVYTPDIAAYGGPDQNLACLGDSISDSTSNAFGSWTSHCVHYADDESADFATSGYKCSEVASTYTSSVDGQAYPAISVMCGTNDCNSASGGDAATRVAAALVSINAIIDDYKTDNPFGRAIVHTIPPLGGTGGDQTLKVTCVNSLNSEILGSGVPNADCRSDHVLTLDSDSNDQLDGAGVGDYIHPSDAQQVLIAADSLADCGAI
ncbi:MAG: SGNH/GDSL hydrolase family protein [Candidatus Nanopelagicales bacterium]